MKRRKQKMVIFISFGRFAVTFVTPVSISMKLLSAISLPSDLCWDRGQPLTRYTHTIQKGVCWKRGGMETTKSHIVMCLFLSTLSPFLSPFSLNLQVMKLMDHMPFFLETKFDGDRMQLHKQGNQYRYFSRRCTIVSFCFKFFSHSFGKKSKASLLHMAAYCGQVGRGEGGRGLFCACTTYATHKV